MSPRSELDYSLGWRWLLPFIAGDCVELQGFLAAEAQFLRDAFPVSGRQDDASSPDVLIVKGSMEAADSGLPQKEQRICVLADRAQGRRWRKILASQFQYVREYALLPAENPRVVVPLSCRQHAALALSLHRPGRWIARLGIGVARWLVRQGSFYLLQGKVLLIASRTPVPAPYGAVMAGLTGEQDYALYLGTPDDNRKTVVLPLGEGMPDTIVKMGTSPKARTALENEAAALAMLADSPLAHRAPKLVKVVCGEQAVALHQEYRPRRWAPRQNLGKSVVAFLAELSLLDRHWKPLAHVLGELPALSTKDLSHKAAAAYHKLYERLQQLADAGFMICLHRSHGDFAPWNCTWADGGLFVYDWEASQPQGLALSDAFYYLIAPALLVQRKPDANKTLKAALQWVDRVCAAAGLEVDARVYLALWLFVYMVSGGELYANMTLLLEEKWNQLTETN